MSHATSPAVIATAATHLLDTPPVDFLEGRVQPVPQENEKGCCSWWNRDFKCRILQLKQIALPIMALYFRFAPGAMKCENGSTPFVEAYWLALTGIVVNVIGLGGASCCCYLIARSSAKEGREEGYRLDAVIHTAISITFLVLSGVLCAISHPWCPLG